MLHRKHVVVPSPAALGLAVTTPNETLYAHSPPAGSMVFSRSEFIQVLTAPGPHVAALGAIGARPLIRLSGHVSINIIGNVAIVA